MTESWTMTRDTGASTRSPAFASRAATRERIFSARVLGNDPLPQERIELVHGQRPGVGEGLDAACDLAQLVRSELEAELLRAMVDRVFPGQTVRDVHRALKAEIRGIEDLVAVRVEIDRLRVHARLVVKRVLAGHEVVIGDLDSDERSDELVELAQPRKVVFLADGRGVVGVHPRDETAEWRDPVALADAEHARVDVRRAAIEDSVDVGDRASGVVVAVELDVAAHVVAELDGERVTLARARDADGVRDA